VVNKFKAVKIPPLGPSLYLPSARASGRTEVYSLLHDLLIVYRIPDVDISAIWHMSHCRVEVEDIGRLVLSM
jgi:hypothetical protein